MYEGAPRAHEVNVFLIETLGFVGQQSHAHFDSARAQMRKALARNAWVGIFYWRDYTRDAGLDQSVRARRCAPKMRMRFEGDIGRSSARTYASLLQCNRLGVFQILVDIITL